MIDSCDACLRRALLIAQTEVNDRQVERQDLAAQRHLLEILEFGHRAGAIT